MSYIMVGLVLVLATVSCQITQRTETVHIWAQKV